MSETALELSDALAEAALVLRASILPQHRIVGERAAEVLGRAESQIALWRDANGGMVGARADIEQGRRDTAAAPPPSPEIGEE